jgi:hypothetical protein
MTVQSKAVLSKVSQVTDSNNNSRSLDLDLASRHGLAEDAAEE